MANFRRVAKAQVLITAEALDTFECINYNINLVCNATAKAEAFSEQRAARCK